MQLPRWNNCKNPRTKGKTAQPSISHSGQGLEGKKSSSLPVEGGIFSLTFPFIDQAFALINLLDYPLHHDWLRFDCVYHLHKSRTETTTSEVFQCGIFACSSLFWRWCSLHSESSSWVERCRIFTETIFGHPQPAKNPWKRVRIVSRSTFAGNS